MAYSRERQRAYARQHYLDNKDVYLARARLRNAKVRDEVGEFIRNYKSTTPCVDCGVQYHYAVMEFDHLRDKEANIGDVARKWSLKRIQAEISKCDLVCANCHRVRTFNRLSED